MTYVQYFKGVHGLGISFWKNEVSSRDISKLEIPNDADGFYFYDTLGNDPEQINISGTYYKRGMVVSQEELEEQFPGTYIINNLRTEFRDSHKTVICSSRTAHIYHFVDGIDEVIDSRHS